MQLGQQADKAYGQDGSIQSDHKKYKQVLIQVMSKQILTLVEEKEVNPENVHVYLEICVYMNIYVCNNNL